jgi:hypothetical protein
VVRDTGSANGVYLNGRRVERAPIKPGDTIRLGGVRLTMLAEIGETLVVALDDAELSRHAGEPTAMPPVRRSEPGPQPRSTGPSTLPTPPATGPTVPMQPPGRPATVAVLSVLWVLFVVVSISVLALAAARLEAGLGAWAAAGAASLAVAVIGITMARGLWVLAPWARHLQIVFGYAGLVACPFTLASATVLLYMGRPDVGRTFEPASRPRERGGAGPAEPTFAISILAMLLVGFMLAGAALFVLWPRH